MQTKNHQNPVRVPIEYLKKDQTESTEDVYYQTKNSDFITCPNHKEQYSEAQEMPFPLASKSITQSDSEYMYGSVSDQRKQKFSRGKSHP